MSKAYCIASKEPLDFLTKNRNQSFSVTYQHNHYFYIRYDETINSTLLDKIYTAKNIYFETFELQNKQGDDFIIKTFFTKYIKK